MIERVPWCPLHCNVSPSTRVASLVGNSVVACECMDVQNYPARSSWEAPRVSVRRKQNKNAAVVTGDEFGTLAVRISEEHMDSDLALLSLI